MKALDPFAFEQRIEQNYASPPFVAFFGAARVTNDRKKPMRIFVNWDENQFFGEQIHAFRPTFYETVAPFPK